MHNSKHFTVFIKRLDRNNLKHVRSLTGVQIFRCKRNRIQFMPSGIQSFQTEEFQPCQSAINGRLRNQQTMYRADYKFVSAFRKSVLKSEFHVIM